MGDYKSRHTPATPEEIASDFLADFLPSNAPHPYYFGPVVIALLAVRGKLSREFFGLSGFSATGLLPKLAD
ncbi:hypothetical protein BO79DRAFT_152304 [Aspergillus costaricaensis CBS 115574]|uniref:Uncharacterized protein n=1 Tax=Aspergillus costaricaensis CBS 115574 TaxID=1448317 RepID=A0ACD1I8Y7_9EURO|nr:hypothetical protein BO79DRAFT_152304 [Aspergillus costaricaensis CBS 115574]RAK86825.1 hypothetical protein BO79DRAFT_152304 [Aspergillus costaricaensis CBS 115574]